jgi:hypothetical protein
VIPYSLRHKRQKNIKMAQGCRTGQGGGPENQLLQLEQRRGKTRGAITGAANTPGAVIRAGSGACSSPKASGIGLAFSPRRRRIEVPSLFVVLPEHKTIDRLLVVVKRAQARGIGQASGSALDELLGVVDLQELVRTTTGNDTARIAIVESGAQCGVDRPGEMANLRNLSAWWNITLMPASVIRSETTGMGTGAPLEAISEISPSSR